MGEMLAAEGALARLEHHREQLQDRRVDVLVATVGANPDLPGPPWSALGDRDQAVELRVTPAERAALQTAARNANLPATVYRRLRIWGRPPAPTVPVGQAIRRPDPKRPGLLRSRRLVQLARPSRNIALEAEILDCLRGHSLGATAGRVSEELTLPEDEVRRVLDELVNYQEAIRSGSYYLAAEEEPVIHD